MKAKLKKCKVCKKTFEQFNSLVSWCSPTCGYKLSQSKLKEKKANEWKIEKKALREKLKTLGQYEAEAKKSFQKWIRLRDKNKPCISCGTVTAPEWHASHYFDCNKYSGMIFNEKNVHKSCNKCNVYLHGNLLEYRKGLIERFNVGHVEYLEEISDKNRVYKYSKKELIAKKLQYDLKIKEIK